MSSNLAVINFAIGETLTTTGKTTLADTLLSSSSASFQGLSTTDLDATGKSTFNTSLPKSIKTPTLDAELTTKTYVDNAETNLDKRITDNDTAVKHYTDLLYNELNDRVSTNDTDVRFYIDASYNELNDRVSTNDTNVRFYIDASYNELNDRITSTGLQISNIQVKPLFYVYQSTNVTQTIQNASMTKVAYPSVLYYI
jgi:uncharacterized FlaG/YvyC family protein